MFFPDDIRQYFDICHLEPWWLLPRIHIAYVQAIEVEPKSADLHAGKAQALIREEQYLDAIQNCMKAIELEPKLPKAYLRMGWVSVDHVCTDSHLFPRLVNR